METRRVGRGRRTLRPGVAGGFRQQLRDEVWHRTPSVAAFYGRVPADLYDEITSAHGDAFAQQMRSYDGQALWWPSDERLPLSGQVRDSRSRTISVAAAGDPLTKPKNGPKSWVAENPVMYKPPRLVWKASSSTGKPFDSLTFPSTPAR